MLHVFKEVEKKRTELEELRIIIQATEITYRQKGEIPTAERLKNLETNVAKAIHLLSAAPSP
ncbi:hypothetical protein [Sporomusa malonica]|uniref:Uncharacterized protein n=1 Tax=Sporomusa malonica TaxID=112901 RepID=A0A1W2CQ14_9FIRM|nr:hypothetical protein [Sporomusa malonica]SMC87345.1 hypothetical protein SAMN04488500_11187 [Sporomusa malonica]